MTEKLNENYAKAYNGRLGFGQRPALLVVDMVQAYFEPTCPLYAEVESELAQTIDLIAAARTTKVPVIYTNVVYHESGINGGLFFKKAPVLECFREGNPMGAWPPGIAPNAEELVISKQYPSAFFGTSLASTLNAAGIDTVITCGVTTSGCIRATCLDTVSHGFIPIIVEDACGDRHEEPHKANIFDMDAKYADVVKASEVLQYFESR
ncbi:MAG: isochorismatase family protein [Gammaproteobacteria bacterium]